MSDLHRPEANPFSAPSSAPKLWATIFRNKGVFSPEFAPEKVLLRDAELLSVEKVMRDLYRNALPRHLLVVGSYGIGKTLTVRWLHQKLLKDSEPTNLRLKSIYVNCKTYDTESKVLKRLLDELSDLKSDVRFRVSEPFAKLERACKKADWILAILDDVDNLLMRVHAAYEKILFLPSRLIPNLHYTMITNNLDLPQWMIENIPVAIQETLRYEIIAFPPYDATQLGLILRDRAKLGLRPEAYDEGALSYAAAISSTGDLGARGAIDLIRIGGEIAEEEDSPKLTEEHVRKAVPKLEKMRTLELLKVLSPVRIAIIAHIVSKGRAKVSDIVKDLEETKAGEQHLRLGERLLRYHLSALRDMGVIVMQRRGRGRGRGIENRIYLNPNMEEHLRWALKHLKGA